MTLPFIIPPVPGDGIRLTVNKPASDLVFAGAAGVEFRYDENTVQVRPSSRSPIKLVPRSERGGAAMTVMGDKAAELWRALIVLAGALGRPFFSLHRVGAGADWYALRSEPAAPPRHVPHLRLWLTGVELDEPKHIEALTEPAWCSIVRQAAATIKQHETSARIGRPSREVQAAQETMSAFRRLVADLLPPVVDRAAIQAARDLLDKALR